MKTTHTSLPFAGHTLHFVEFDPASFREQDLLWLPHYAQLQHAGRKRKTEHLAGRIAAIYALREYGGIRVIGQASESGEHGSGGCRLRVQR